MKLKAVFARLFSLIFMMQLITPPAFSAQLILQAPDVQPPTIEFELDSTDIPEGLNYFRARVTDNVGVSNVILFYRGAGDIAFSSKPMGKVEQDADIYEAELYIDPVIIKKLEIYLKAEDVSGNSVFEGKKFTPLSYNVIPNTYSNVNLDTAAPDEEEEGISTLTWILIGLGAALVAGSSGGGGGGSKDDTGSITVTTEVPN